MRELVDLIQNTTIAYRKGAVVRYEDQGPMRVWTIDGYPETPSHAEVVDVHFITVGFTEAVAAVTPAGFYDLIRASERGEFQAVSMERLAEGPSYIELGAWLGSQELALRFLALGEHLGCWQVITPAILGATGKEADKLAGVGYVMNAGLRPLDAISAR